MWWMGGSPLRVLTTAPIAEATTMSRIRPLLLLVTTASALDSSLFDAWLRQHERSYAPGEYSERQRNFEASVENIRSLQKLSPHATYDIFADDRADWSADERANGGSADISGLPVQPPFAPEEARKLRDSPIDWVARGAVTSPQSQGRCGTCLDFSGTASVESAWYIAGHRPLERLSVQQVVDCCGGGPGYCMDWVQSTGGLVRETDYPLANHSDPSIHGCRSPCNTTAEAKRVAKLTSISCLKNHEEDQIRAMLEEGPVSVSIAAKWLNGYKGGLINCTAEGIDHAVLLVGYGRENGFEYWKLRNSWGPHFGEEGYFRFVRGHTCLRGACQAHAEKSE